MIDQMKIDAAIAMVESARTVYLCGNGGSAANANHIANDLVSVGVRAIALTADVSVLTAIANDHGYENIFSRQLQLLAAGGDLLIVLSGSGESRNIIRALNKAKAKAISSIAIIGDYHPGGSRASRLSTLCICAGKDMQEAEEQQIVFGHTLYRAFDRRGK